MTLTFKTHAQATAFADRAARMGWLATIEQADLNTFTVTLAPGRLAA